jgi:glucokinase
VAAVNALGVANLAFLFPPDAVVVGGGVGHNGEMIVPVVRRYLDVHGPTGLPVPIEVLIAELGDDAGLAGVAAWRRATRGAGLG